MFISSVTLKQERTTAGVELTAKKKEKRKPFCNSTTCHASKCERHDKEERLECKASLNVPGFTRGSGTLAALLPRSRKACYTSSERRDVEQLDTRIQKFRKGQIEFTWKGHRALRNFHRKDETSSCRRILSALLHGHLFFSFLLCLNSSCSMYKQSVVGGIEGIICRETQLYPSGCNTCTISIWARQLAPGLQLLSFDREHIVGLQ